MSKKLKTLKELKEQLSQLQCEIDERERKEAERAGRALLQSCGCNSLEELRKNYKLVKIEGGAENEKCS